MNPKKSGLYTNILMRVLSGLEMMLEAHNKVFIFRFDLSCPDYSIDNKLSSDVIRRLKKRVKQHYKTKNVFIGWVREQERAKKQHYHCLAILDGNKIQNDFMLKKWILEIAESVDSRPHWAGYHNIRRNSAEFTNKLNDATHHISYLAKSRGKNYKTRQTKNYFFSHTQRN